PLNIAAFSIPVLGEARTGKLLASAGESILGRAAVRGGIGVAQGAVGGAALVPFDWLQHTQDGQDYTYADALKSIVASAGMGGAFHAGGGLLGDLFARLRGRPLAGAPAIGGTHVPEELLGAGVDVDEIPGVTNATRPLFGEAQPEQAPAGGPVLQHPAEVLADLPPAAREDVVRASIANLISGEKNNAGELLQEAAKADPRIAESVGPYFEAYHGSPHDFDRFDLDKVGTGEGAQSYGHGLYFAENPAVGTSYRSAGAGLSDVEHIALDALEAAGGDRARAIEQIEQTPDHVAQQ